MWTEAGVASAGQLLHSPGRPRVHNGTGHRNLISPAAVTSVTPDKASYCGSSIHVHSKPDRLAGAGTGLGPPGLPGDAGWTGRDAGFTSFHVTEDPDGVPATAAVWIDPVLTWKS